MRHLSIACGLLVVTLVSFSARADDAGVACSSPCDGPCQSCRGADLGWPGAVNGVCALAPGGYEGSPSCAPYVCTGRAASCDLHCLGDDSLCAPGFYCSDSLCVPRKGQGVSCAADCTGPGACRVCASGHCIDGVCCDSTCEGTCVACSRAAHGSVDGTCGPVAAGTNGRTTCRTEPIESCGESGACDGAGRCALYPAATVCSPPRCITSVAWTYVCDGKGGCTHNPVTCPDPGCDSAGLECASMCGVGGCDASAVDAASESSALDAASGPVDAPGAEVSGSSSGPDASPAGDDGGTCGSCGAYACHDGSCLSACVTLDDCSMGNVCREDHSCGPFVPPPDDGGGCSVARMSAGRSSPVGKSAPIRAFWLLALAGLASSLGRFRHARKPRRTPSGPHF